jgi:hypothetical protein
MSLTLWIPLTFGLGLASMGFCYAFLLGCEKV